MGFTTSPNMNLPIPGVGTESGPNYAFDVNAALTLVDSHDHTPGKGVQITPAGININSALSFNGNPLLSASYISLSGTVTPTTMPSTVLQSLSVGTTSSINELYYTDSNGTETQITKNGQVNAIAASIPGESYVSGTFIWDQTQSSLPTTPANFAIGSVTLSPNVANAYPSLGVTLSPPSGIASAYSINLPLLPSVTSFMSISNTGVISTPAPIAGTSGQYLGTNGSIPVWTSFVVASAPTQTVLTSGSGTYTTPANTRSIRIRMIGGGGGGGASSNTSPTAGTAGGTTSFSTYHAAGGGGGGAGTPSVVGAGGVPGSNTGSPTVSILGGGGSQACLTNSSTPSPTSGAGGSGVFGGAGGARTNSVGAAGQNNSGGGGSGAGSNNIALYNSAGGGASGSYIEQTIASPSATYTYSIGSGGPGGSSGEAGGNGGSGIIIVDEYY